MDSCAGDHHLLCSPASTVPESPPLERESSCQSIIPGLLDDLALNCLAKVSHGYHGILESVSKRWREALRSLDYSSLKSSQGSCGDWLFVLTEDSLLWEAYDPDANRWHPLPPMPRPRLDFHHLGFSCVTVCKSFLVLGGYYGSPASKCDPSFTFSCTNETNYVMAFDPFLKNWRRVASMRNARADFACATICGKVYVAGGSQVSKALDHAEVYDPVSDRFHVHLLLNFRWEDLPSMPVQLIDCFSISYGGKFHVIGKTERSQQRHNTYVIFDPLKGNWHMEHDLSLLDRLQRHATVVSCNSIFTVDAVVPDHGRQLHPFRYGLLELHGKFYCFGGKALKYDAIQFVVLKLKQVTCWDPLISAKDWKEVRSMFQSCGAVAGCGSMRE